MMIKNSGWPWAIVACFFSSSIWVFTRELIPVLPVSAQLFWRLFAASVLILLIFRKQIRLDRISKISFKDFSFIFLRALGLYCLGTTLAATAIQETKYGTVVLFLSLPVGSILATLLLKEKLGARAWTAIVLSSLGVGLAVFDRHGISISGGRGEFMAFMASIVMALALITRRWQSSALNEFELTFSVLFLASLQFLAGTLVFGIPLTFSPSLSVISLLGLSGIWTAAFLYSVAAALMRMKVFEANLVFGFQPLLGALIGFILYQENVSLFSGLAAILLLLSIVILNRRSN
jgi:drug/metabolite transporter (DMT)-like permease